MTGLRLLVAATALAVGLGAPAARADGDVTKGQRVFSKCRACHEIETTDTKVGPTLKGVIGRKAGTVQGFAYSEAMVNSGIVWNADIIATYVKDPKQVVAGNKMSFEGLKREKEIADLVAFIQAKCCS